MINFMYLRYIIEVCKQNHLLYNIFLNNEERLGTIYCFIKFSNCNQFIYNCRQHYAIICEIMKHDVFTATDYQFEYFTELFFYKYSVIISTPVNYLITPCIYMNFDNLILLYLLIKRNLNKIIRLCSYNFNINLIL